MRLLAFLAMLLLFGLSGQAYAGQAPVAVGKNVVCAGVAVLPNGAESTGKVFYTASLENVKASITAGSATIMYHIQCVVLVAINPDGSVGLTFQDILRDPVAGTDITTTQSAYVKIGGVFLFAGALPNMPKLQLYTTCANRATFMPAANTLPPPPPAGSCN